MAGGGGGGSLYSTLFWHIFFNYYEFELLSFSISVSRSYMRTHAYSQLTVKLSVFTIYGCQTVIKVDKNNFHETGGNLS